MAPGSPQIQSVTPTGFILSILPLLRTMLVRQGCFYWRLQGVSMMPTLPAGCLLKVRPLLSSPRPGDIIVFACADTLIAHRLIWRMSWGWITWGDACFRPDAPVPFSHLVGVVDQAHFAGKRCWPSRCSPFQRRRWLWRRRHFHPQFRK